MTNITADTGPLDHSERALAELIAAEKENETLRAQLAGVAEKMIAAQELASILNEQLSDTRAELNKWRAWGDRMPTFTLGYGGFTPEFAARLRVTEIWMDQRPEPERANAL